MAPLAIPLRLSFRKQITLTYVVGFCLLISAFAGFLIITEKNNLQRDSLNETTSMAQALSASALPWVLADDVAGLQEAVHAFHAYPELYAVMVISPDGRVLAHSDPSKVGKYITDVQSQGLIKAPHAIRVIEDSADIVDVAVPIEINDRQVGWARVTSTKLASSANLRMMILESIVFLLGSTLLSLIAAILIANRLGRSIGSLVQVAEGVQAGNVSARASTAGGEDEVARLGASLNHMLDALSQNEHDLRAASHYTRSLIEASLDPLVTISAEGKITDVNRATEKTTGRSRSELLGTDFADYFTDPDHARAGYQQVFAQGFVTDYPLALRNLDGHVIEVLYNASVYRNEAGKVLGVFAAAREVTESLRVRKELQDSEQKFRTLAEAMPQIVWITRPDGWNIYFNQQWVDYTGMTLEESYGHGWNKPFHPDDQKRAWDAWQNATQTDGIYSIECRLRRADGAYRWWLIRGVSLHDANGKIINWFGTCTDIEDIKQSETEIREKEERLSLATMINGVGIWDWNLRTQEMIWDDSMFALYHMHREDFIGTEEAWRKSLHPDDLERGDQEVADAIAGIKPFDTVFRVVWPNGEIHHIKAVAKIFRDEQGTAVRMLGTNLDITERQNAEMELRELSVRNRLILDSAGEGIYGLDIDGKCTFVNPAASQMLGYGVDELIGRHSHPIFHHTRPDGSPFPEAECPVHAAYTDGVTHRGSDLYWRKDGSSFPVEFTSTPIIEAGQFTGAVVTFRDITDRKRAEIALREQESKFRTLFETANDGIFVQDAAVFVDCNQRGAEMYGLTKEGVIGHSPAEFCPAKQPDGRLSFEVAGEKIHAAMTGESQQFEWQALRHDKTTLDVEISLNRIELGGSVYLQAIVRDITERKQAEQRLRESEEKFSLAFHASPDLLAITRADGTILDVNEGYSQMLGYSRDESIDKSTADLSIWGNPADRVTFMSRLKEFGQVTSFETTLRRKDGTLITVLDSARSIRLQGEQCMLSIAHDITERKRIEEALREQETHSQSLLRLSRNMERSQTYADILNAAQDEVKIAMGYQNLWVYLFTENKQYLKAIAAGGPVSDTVMSEEGTATLTIKGDRMLEEIAASKEIVLIEDARTDDRVNKEIVARLGMRTIVNIPIMLFDRHMGCVGTGTFGEQGVRVPSSTEQKYLMALASHMAAALDRIHLLAERKLAEDEVKALNRDLEQRVLARTADLQAANQELESFSYSVSHDLRTPLRAIDGFSQILLEDYTAKLDEEGKRLLNVVRDNTSKMGNLIDDILKFSRAGRLEMNFSELNTYQMARDVYDELRPSAAGHETRVEIGPLPPVSGDRAMIRQVFVNLISNAIKFTHNKEPAIIRVAAYAENNETVYFVQDNGAGFDMRYVDRLFGVFQRLHTESEFEGTGIGLAIVKRIITRHGGRVWADGKLNEGATIYFTLPAAETRTE